MPSLPGGEGPARCASPGAWMSPRASTGLGHSGAGGAPLPGGARGVGRLPRPVARPPRARVRTGCWKTCVEGAPWPAAPASRLPSSKPCAPATQGPSEAPGGRRVVGQSPASSLHAARSPAWRWHPQPRTASGQDRTCHGDRRRLRQACKGLPLLVLTATPHPQPGLQHFT